MKITNATPILFVDEIESSLPLWTGPLGYQKQAEVPHEGRLGFVLLTGAAGEVMLQTRASLAADLPAVAALAPSMVLYADVDDLDRALAGARRVKGTEVVVAPRTAPYGAREAGVRTPSGHIVLFAQKQPDA
jgi:hypothetical protein